MGDGVASLAKKISDVEVLGIPLGEAVLAGGSALIVSELTDAIVTPRLPTVPIAAIKAGEAFVVSRWGYRVLGTSGARLASIILTYDAFRALVPLDDWIKQLIEKITGGGGTSAATTSGSGSSSSAGGNGHVDGMDALRLAVSVGGGQ